VDTQKIASLKPFVKAAINEGLSGGRQERGEYSKACREKCIDANLNAHLPGEGRVETWRLVGRREY